MTRGAYIALQQIHKNVTLAVVFVYTMLALAQGRENEAEAEV